ncbi:cadherin-like beta sandwich domain-containing protein [Murimonas intestini]|uniref:Cadherin-like beta sandwich domain-containing protein n=1 Tax=Murimonas intestini TaxID=1337051 RepID=A0AB73SZ32_9FIRM|nr:cadherin-like beta sandwich domain-containing protein [Murimonas intestini]MCR1842877.1 hypothetical protein [Murimonas intestini]MCR1868158.1 hypothetical protein [Murimonas intestini]MCR1885350.1 hypothetical protein [Murimonas intestini]
MNNFKRRLKHSLWMALVLICMFSMPVLASGQSDDNSLAGLGITNGEVSPEFDYSTVEYTVTVPAGTTKLELDPQTSNENATIVDISDTTLVDGAVDVSITVRSESGIDALYVLHVKEAEGAPATEPVTEAPQTQPATQAQPEVPQTETPNVQASLAESEANSLRAQVDDLKVKNDLTMKIIYGLIAFAVILLFIIINLILKNRDLKDDLRDAEDELDYQTNEFARKEKSMSTDNYYAPNQTKGKDDRHEASAAVRDQEVMEETFRQTPEQLKPSENPRKDSGRKNRKPSRKDNRKAQQESQPSVEPTADYDQPVNQDKPPVKKAPPARKEAPAKKEAPAQRETPRQKKSPEQSRPPRQKRPSDQPRAPKQDRAPEPKQVQDAPVSEKDQDIDVNMVDL